MAMTFAVGLALIAQSAIPAIAEAPRQNNPVAVAVSASVEVLRPAVVRANGTVEMAQESLTVAPQRERDSLGTVWIEFS